MIYHLTEKLRKRLQLPPLSAAVPSPAGASGTGAHGALRWYGNTFEAGGVSYILTTNAASLYSVVLAAGDFGDERAYVQAFLGALEPQMKADGLAALYDEVIAPASGDVVLAKTAERSVVQSMSDLAAKACRHLARGDSSMEALSRHLNDTPLKSLAFRTPRATHAGLPWQEEITK